MSPVNPDQFDLHTFADVLGEVPRSNGERRETAYNIWDDDSKPGSHVPPPTDKPGSHVPPPTDPDARNQHFLRNFPKETIFQGDTYTPPGKKSTYTLSHTGFGGVEAHTKGGRTAGRLGGYTGSFDPASNVIGGINVSTQHRRKGLGTAMLDFARQENPNLHHSTLLSTDGKEYAAASPRPWQPQLGTPDSPTDLGTSYGGEYPVAWATDYRPSFTKMNAASFASREAGYAETRRIQENEKKYQQGTLFE